MLDRLKSEFAKHTLTLLVGTGLAQAVPVLAAPLLSRMYQPKDFGAFGLFLSLAGILSVLATGRYEVAILLPPKDEDAVNIVVLSIAVTCLFCAIVFLVVVFFRQNIANLLGNPEIAPWLALVPLMVWLTSVYQAFNYWFNRRKQYRRLAINRISRSLFMIGVSLGLGFRGRVSGGLIVGAVVGQGVATLQFIRPWLRERRSENLTISKARVLAMGLRYVHFVKYSLLGDTINTISGQMPILILSIFFGPVIVGYFNLTQRVLYGPSSIISTAIGDVFRQRASEDRNVVGNFRHIWLKTFKTLGLLSLPVYGAVAIFAPVLFAFVFGHEWRTAGEYARIMSPFFMLSFTASILSRSTYIAEKQKQDMLWQMVLFVLISVALLVGAWYKQPAGSLGLYTMAYSGMYLIYLWMCFKYSGGDVKRAGKGSEAA